MKRLALGLLLALAATACSDDTPTVAPPTTSPAPTTSSPAASGGTINVASSSLGQILVDAQGRTLYMFTNDPANSSACQDGCTQTWPALLVTGAPTAGTGIDASKLGTTSRTDGSTQVTYNQHPLYHFSGDAAAGDTKGQGIGGKWFVVSPAGEPIMS